MLALKIDRFRELQGDETDTRMAQKLCLSRSQLWRITSGKSSVSGKFVSEFLKNYPHEKFEDYFFYV